MKYTDFFALISAIKNQEYKELYRAVEAHNGNYEWNLDEGEERPIIAVNVSGTCPNPKDVEIYSVSIIEGKLNIKGTDKEDGYEVDFEPSDIFAGHLSSIIDYLPPINGIEDVTL